MDPTDTSTDDAPTLPPFEPLIPEWDGHDMLIGPCSCGATHYPGDIEDLAAAAVARIIQRERAAAAMGQVLDPGDIEARLVVADRLAEFRVNVLASLGLDASDLPTLRSVLNGQLVCEREAAEPTPRRAPLPLTVRQAMTLAADTGAVVNLVIRWRGDVYSHVCRVSADGLGWTVIPGVPESVGGSVGWVAADDGSSPSPSLAKLPVVVSCEPVPKGLAIVPEGDPS